MNYTKGEWKVQKVDEDNARVVFNDPEPIIEIYTPYHEALANANLIAAAPKLHKWLKFLSEQVTLMGYLKPEIQAEIKQAVIEAEGRDQ